MVLSDMGLVRICTGTPQDHIYISLALTSIPLLRQYTSEVVYNLVSPRSFPLGFTHYLKP